LGVLAAVHVAQVEGEVVDLPARKIAKIDQPLNLGIVYKAEAIDLCVDLLLARAGLSRVGTLSQPGVSPSSADELLEESAGD
jgi:hypothetical protein